MFRLLDLTALHQSPVYFMKPVAALMASLIFFVAPFFVQEVFAQDNNSQKESVKSDTKEKPYYLAKSWGSEGSANGQFLGPSGIGASFTEVYVSDIGNSRIQVFDHNGKFIGIIGQSDAYHGSRRLAQMSKPMNIEFQNNEVYVADAGLHRILVYSPQGQFHRGIGLEGKGEAEFKSPTGLAAIIDRSASSTHAHHDMSQGGSFDVRTMKGDKLIVTDSLNNRVHNLRSFGRFLNFIGLDKAYNTNKSGETFDGQFNQPSDVAVDQQSNIYVADGKNNRIVAFKPDGTYSHQWKIPNIKNSEEGWFAGLADTIKSAMFGIKKEEWFSPLRSIAVGPEDNIFIADFFNGRILKYSKQGQLLNQFGITNTDDVRYTYNAVDVAYDGSVFVADYKNQQVHVWRPKGWVAKDTKELENKSFKMYHIDSGKKEKHH